MVESECRQMLRVLIMAQKGSEGNSAFDFTAASQCVFSHINSGTKIFYCFSINTILCIVLFPFPRSKKVFNVAYLAHTQADAKGKWSMGGELAVITRLQVVLCPLRLVFMPSV